MLIKCIKFASIVCDFLIHQRKNIKQKDLKTNKNHYEIKTSKQTGFKLIIDLQTNFLNIANFAKMLMEGSSLIGQGKARHCTPI